MEAPAACPRCAYDLSAIAASWSVECPLRGTCSECGLEFVWADLLNPRFHGQSLFFEHADRRHRAFRHTLIYLFRPRKLWELAPLERPVRIGRMTAFVALASILLLTLGLLLFAATHAVMEAPFGSAPPFAAIAGWLEAALDPLLQVAVPVLGIYTRLWTVWTAGKPAWNWQVYVFGEPLPILGLLVMLLTPLVFIAMPGTLRTCRIRRIHLLRVWAYSLPTTLLTLQATLILLFFFLGQPPGALHRLLQALAVVAWQFFWWRAAVRYYLRLPHATGVAAAAVVIGLLAGTLLMLAFDGARVYLQVLDVLSGRL